MTLDEIDATRPDAVARWARARLGAMDWRSEDFSGYRASAALWDEWLEFLDLTDQVVSWDRKEAVLYRLTELGKTCNDARLATQPGMARFSLACRAALEDVERW